MAPTGLTARRTRQYLAAPAISGSAVVRRSSAPRPFSACGPGGARRPPPYWPDGSAPPPLVAGRALMPICIARRAEAVLAVRKTPVAWWSWPLLLSHRSDAGPGIFHGTPSAARPSPPPVVNNARTGSSTDPWPWPAGRRAAPAVPVFCPERRGRREERFSCPIRMALPSGRCPRRRTGRRSDHQ